MIHTAEFPEALTSGPQVTNGKSRPSICLISFSAIADDPRVRRQGDAFTEAGWTVTAVGLPGARSNPPSWTILTQDSRSQSAAVAVADDSVQADSGNSVEATTAVATSQPNGIVWKMRRLYHSLPEKNRLQIRALLNTARPFRGFVGKFLHRLRLTKFYTKQFMMHWRREDGPDFYLNIPGVNNLYQVASQVKADVYLANDWHALPIAMRLAKENAAHYGYDTHEYALEEYRYRLVWRLFRRPLARSVEEIGLRNALVRSTVSAGIAEDIAKEYGLPKPLLVIRNTPDRQDVVSPPCTGTINVLFHGLVARDRGLEDCIRSVALWRPEFHFQLRGPVLPEYREELENIAASCGVTKRVEFLPPVPMTSLIAEAAAADIGISTPPKTSKHNIYALPNKFFEYIQSGLAVCVADLPDMARILRHYDLGLLIPEVTPESIAETINKFTVEDINRYKQNSTKAAADLNWQVESQILVNAYTEALAKVSPSNAMN